MEQLRVTSNNVRVYSYLQSHVHSFCIGLYVKAGVLYEQPSEVGVTHFLEHVLFRRMGGMTQQELYEKLERMGAYFNATTYREFVQFYITAAPRHFRACAEVMALLLAPLESTAGDVAVERRRVQNEIREEDVFHSFKHHANREVWEDTALSRPIMGSVKGVQKIGLKELSKAQQTDFASGNLCFYVTGCCGEDDVEYLCRQVERHAVAPGEGRDNLAPVPEHFGRRDAHVALETTKEMPDVHLSFDVQTDHYTTGEIHLLYDILFNGSLCRVHTELSERTGLVYSYQSVLDQYRNIGTFTLEYSVAPANLYDAFARTVAIFRSVRTDIAQKEIDLQLPSYSDNYDTYLDDPEGLNWEMTFNNFVLERGYHSLEDVKRQYAAVTPGRLMEMAGEVFRPENLVVLVRAPRNKCKIEKIREIVATL